MGFLVITDVGRTVPPAEEGDECPQFMAFPKDESEASGMEDEAEAEEAE